jgi:hypothetical protein
VLVATPVRSATAVQVVPAAMEPQAQMDLQG